MGFPFGIPDLQGTLKHTKSMETAERCPKMPLGLRPADRTPAFGEMVMHSRSLWWKVKGPSETHRARSYAVPGRGHIFQLFLGGLGEAETLVVTHLRARTRKGASMWPLPGTSGGSCPIFG